MWGAGLRCKRDVFFVLVRDFVVGVSNLRPGAVGGFDFVCWSNLGGVSCVDIRTDLAGNSFVPLRVDESLCWCESANFFVRRLVRLLPQ